jgi:hypothetical protein
MEIEAVIEKLTQKTQSSSGGQIRMLSKTFWAQFGIKRRTKVRTDAIRNEMVKHGLSILIESEEFGKEADQQWLIIRYIPISVPDDDWFKSMSQKIFESEKEVEIFFITPLFQKLGYAEEDFCFGFPITVPDKFKTVFEKRGHPKFLDLVIFDGTDRSLQNAMIVVEAKKSDHIDLEKSFKSLNTADDESKIYTYLIGSACRRVATNGDDLLIYDLSQKGNNSSVLKMHRSELLERWQELYMILGKPIVQESKKA